MSDSEEIHEVLRKIIAEWVKMSQEGEKCREDTTPA
jgi:hypothetical protein